MGIFLRYIVRNLSRRPVVAMLVVGSMALTGFALVTVLAFERGLNAVIGNRGVPERVMVRHGGESLDESELTLEDVQMVGADPEVRRVSAELITSVVLMYGTTPEVTYVRGLEPSGFSMYNPIVVEGRLPERGARELIIGKLAHRRHPALGLGAKLVVAVHKFEIVGIYEAGTMLDGELWTSRNALEVELQRTSPSIAVFEFSSAASAQRREIAFEKEWRFAVMTEEAYFQKANTEAAPLHRSLVLMAVLVVLGSILAAVGALSVVFSGRVPEMCALRAIGFRKARVAILMLVETSCMSIIGASVGVIVANLLLRNYVTFAGIALFFRPAFSQQNNLLSLAMVVLIGCLGAAIPISKTVRVQVQDGLR